MTSMNKNKNGVTLMAVVAFFVAGIANERAVSAQKAVTMTSSACYSTAETVIVDSNVSSSINLTVNKGSSAVISVRGGIKNSATASDKRFKLLLAPDDSRLYIIPTGQADVGHVKSGRLWAKSDFDVGFRIKVVDKDTNARDAIEIIHRSEYERIQALALARATRLIDAANSACESRTRKVRESTVDRGIRRLALEALGQQPIYPLLDRTRQSMGPLHVELTQAQRGKGVVLAFFALENRGHHPVRARQLGLYNRADVLMPTQHVYLMDAIRQTDKSVRALLAAEMPPVEDALQKGRYVLDRTIMPGEKVSGVAALPVTDEFDVTPYGIRLYSGQDKPLAQSGAEGWTTMRPIYREEIEENRRRLALERERERRTRRIAVSLRALYGGFWTDDALADTEIIGGTSMAGVSARLTKGMFPNLAFEAEFTGGRTGQVSFNDASWQQMQGDILREASFGRLQGSGVLRFGEKYVLSMRVGIGVQVTRYNSSFIREDMTMSGPGGSVEFNGMWSVGAGFDTNLGEYWTLGAGAAFAQLVDSNTRTLTTGVHLGYRWDP